MKTAYLYVRVSTDEQKRKGYSLPEQEDRLLKYCESNNIQVKGIYREDFSAKNFNRPEWKQLVWTIKKDRSREENNILFIKWDRFSRNIEYAYEMIGMLRKYKTIAMAIDEQRQLDYGAMMDIFKNITNMDAADRRNLVKLLPPKCVDRQSGDVSLQLTKALSKILVHKTII